MISESEAEEILNILKGRECIVCGEYVGSYSPENVPYGDLGEAFITDACGWRGERCGICHKPLQHGEPAVSTLKIPPAHYTCWRDRG